MGTLDGKAWWGRVGPPPQGFTDSHTAPGGNPWTPKGWGLGVSCSKPKPPTASEGTAEPGGGGGDGTSASASARDHRAGQGRLSQGPEPQASVLKKLTVHVTNFRATSNAECELGRPRCPLYPVIWNAGRHAMLFKTGGGKVRYEKSALGVSPDRPCRWVWTNPGGKQGPGSLFHCQGGPPGAGGCPKWRMEL